MRTAALGDLVHFVKTGSDMVLYELFRNLHHWGPPSFCKQFIAAMELTRSTHVRYQDLARSLPLEGDIEATLDYSLRFLNEKFYQFYDSTGESLALRDSEIENFANYSSKVHPLLLLAYQWATNKQHFSSGHVLAVVKGPGGILSIPSWEKKGYAENHIHLNGAFEASLPILSLLFREWTPPSMYKRYPANNQPMIRRFPYFQIGVLSTGRVVDIGRFALDLIAMHTSLDQSVSQARELRLIWWKLLQGNAPVYQGIFPIKMSEELSPMLHPLLRKARQEFSAGNFNLALFKLFCFVIMVHDQGNSRLLARCAKIIIHVIHVLRSHMVMDETMGLHNFASFYSSNPRYAASTQIPKKLLYNHLAQNLFQNKTTHIDAKLTPQTVLSRDFLDLSKIMEKIVGGEKQRFRFSVHFIRRQDQERQKGPWTAPRHSKLRKQVWNQAWGLIKKLRPAYELSGDPRYNLPRVWGLDIAGNETDAPPEVFAPAIELMRNFVPAKAPIALSPKSTAYPTFYLTVHAGEDFPSLLTGLRRIDETVTFLNMKQGDRLSHALALGFYPTDYAEAHPQQIVTLQERYDDLVWLRQKLMAHQLQIWDSLTRDIEYLGSMLYQDKFGTLNQNDRYLAWRLRAYDPNCFDANAGQRLHFFSPLSEYSHRLDCIRQGKHFKIARDLYRCYHGLAELKIMGEKKLLLNLNTSSKREVDVLGGFSGELEDSELLAVEKIQDHLMNQYAKKGIGIECCPSSNVIIAGLESMARHPIFRFHPPAGAAKHDKRHNRFGIRNGNMKVTINTDDPTIFSTHLPQEFRLLKEAADSLDFPPEVVLDWLEGIRKEGFRSFHALWEEAI